MIEPNTQVERGPADAVLIADEGVVGIHLVDAEQTPVRPVAEAALRELVASLHEWHKVWQTLIAACQDANTIVELETALASFRSQRTIATKIDFNISILRRDARTARFANTIDSNLGRSESSDIGEGSSRAFEAIDGQLRHRFMGSASLLHHHFYLLGKSDRAEIITSKCDNKKIQEVKQRVGELYDEFEAIVISTQRTAVDALSSL